MYSEVPEEIKNYYKACAITRDRIGVVPLVDQISKEILEAIIITSDQKTYFRKRNNVYTIKESIIGANDRNGIRVADTALSRSDRNRGIVVIL